MKMNDRKYTKADLLEREVKNLKETNSSDHKDIMEKITDLDDKFSKFLEKQDRQLETICQRISSLEFWRINLMAKVSLGIAIISFAFTTLWQWVLKKFVNN
jgi:hypothetical protein